MASLLLSGCATVTDRPNTTQNNNQENTSSQNTNQGNTNQGTIRQDTGNRETTRITEEEAKNVALSQAGLTAEQVTFIKCNLDWDDGREYYDVEFYTQDGKEYDFEIAPTSGEILDYDFDVEYYAP